MIPVAGMLRQPGHVWNDGRGGASGFGARLKICAERQTHSTLQLSLSVQIVGYPKEETDRVKQRLSPLVLKVLCSVIFHAFGHLLEDGAPPPADSSGGI